MSRQFRLSQLMPVPTAALWLLLQVVTASAGTLDFRVCLAQAEYLAGQEIIVTSIVRNNSVRPVELNEPSVCAYKVTFDLQRLEKRKYQSYSGRVEPCGTTGHDARLVSLAAGMECRTTCELSWQFANETLPAGEYQLLANYSTGEPGQANARSVRAAKVQFRVIEPTGAEATWDPLRLQVDAIAIDKEVRHRVDWWQRRRPDQIEWLASMSTSEQKRQAEDLLERFVHQHPHSVYAPQALARIASLRLQARDLHGYMRVLQRQRAYPISETLRNELIYEEASRLAQLGGNRIARDLALQGTCTNCEQLADWMQLRLEGDPEWSAELLP